MFWQVPILRRTSLYYLLSHSSFLFELASSFEQPTFLQFWLCTIITIEDGLQRLSKGTSSTFWVFRIDSLCCCLFQRHNPFIFSILFYYQVNRIMLLSSIYFAFRGLFNLICRKVYIFPLSIWVASRPTSLYSIFHLATTLVFLVLVWIFRVTIRTAADSFEKLERSHTIEE